MGWLRSMVGALGVAAVALAGTPAAAQIRTVDPNTAASAPYAPAPERSYDLPPAGDPQSPADAYPPSQPDAAADSREEAPTTAADADAPPPPAPPPPPGSTRPRTETGQKLADAAADDPTATYQRDDLLAAAEGVFGKGAEGLARLLEKVLKEQGRPNAYIGGREIGGAFAVGLRYGSGTLHHRIEGDRPIYWTGPSLGFDFGGNGAKTFVLVYNLYDSQELFHRFPQAEGAAYFIGGFTASYLRRGDVVLIPIRLGLGWRLGANVGYMRFSERAKIVPF